VASSSKIERFRALDLEERLLSMAPVKSSTFLRNFLDSIERTLPFLTPQRE